MKQLLILGAGGLGRELLDWARQSAAHGRDWTVKGFLDDNPRALDGFAVDVPVLGPIATHQPAADEVFVCAMGNIAPKRQCVETIRGRGGAFVQVVHRSAVVAPSAILGTGVILCPGAIVTAHARLGDFVTVNLHSSVAHDAVLGDWSQLHCHVDITGAVRLGAGVLVGSHAAVLPRVRVGDGAVIGAGAIVGRDVPAGATVYGAPARFLAPATEARS